MAKCSGCASVFHADSNCIALDGVGSAVDPLVATPIIDPATNTCFNCGPNGLRLVIDPNVNNTLSCGPAGLFVPTPPGGGNVLFHTVSTVGFPFSGISDDTPEPFRSAADFQGDGVSDNVEIQAAIDLAASAGGGNSNIPVYIHPGSYHLTAPIIQKGIPLISWGGNFTILVQNTVGVPVIDNVGSTNALIEGITLSHSAGGAAAYRGGSTRQAIMRRCGFAGGTLGADLGLVVSGTGSGGIWAEQCTFVNVGVLGEHCLHLRGAESRIVDCFFDGDGGIRSSGGAGAGGTSVKMLILGNIFSVLNNGIHFTGTDVGFTFSNIIANNNVEIFDDGIIIDGTQFENNVTNNLIFNYGLISDVTRDGIRLAGTASRNNIQGNMCRAFGAGGRHGVNISAVGCTSNLATNNDLLNSGAAASFNDVGTATITTAGNRL